MHQSTLFSPTNLRNLTAAGLGLALLAALPAQVSALEANGPAPACSLREIQTGKALELSQYRGQVLYLDFWASWCGPCAESFPFMNQLHSTLQGQGLAIVAVNLDEQRNDADGFLAKTPARFTIAGDPQGQCPERFGVETMPTSYLIDRQGRVRHVQYGFRPSESTVLQEKIRILLAEPS
jgi:thiol-disulfide isomerase/thioredoxin